jgi:hypothetical protein
MISISMSRAEVKRCCYIVTVELTTNDPVYVAKAVVDLPHAPILVVHDIFSAESPFPNIVICAFALISAFASDWIKRYNGQKS